jgi:hypothetical protein
MGIIIFGHVVCTLHQIISLKKYFYCLGQKQLHLILFRWRYQTAKELEGNNFWGYLATYSGAGSVQDLGQTSAETKLILRELLEGLWIGRGTRFVSVDFTVYNANVNLFCVVK